MTRNATTHPFGPDGPSAAEFFSKYWRRRPVWVKGGAKALLGRQFPITGPRFDALVDRAERAHPTNVTRGGSGVVFVQQIDQVDAQLHALARELGRTFALHDPWFDGVSTQAGSSGGIGSHYDDSDNFVLQQSGHKRWLLAPASELSPDELARRMLKDPSVGNAYMPDLAQSFQLEAGDLLYIPIFWLHWGGSAGDSTSVSLVCNTSNALRSLLPLAHEVLLPRAQWWSPFSRMASLADAERLFDDYWDQLTQDDVRARARTLWLARFDKASTSAPAPALNRPAPQRVRPLPTFDNDPPLDELLAALEDADAPDPIRPSNAAVRRLSTALDLLFDALAPTPTGELLAASSLELHALEPAALASVASRPELRAWVWRAFEAVHCGHCARMAEISAILPAHLLPALQQVGLATKAIPISADESTVEIVLIPQGLRWSFEPPLATRGKPLLAQLYRNDGPSPNLLVTRGAWSATLDFDGACASAGRLDPLPRIGGDGPWWVNAGPWLPTGNGGASSDTTPLTVPADLRASVRVRRELEVVSPGGRRWRRAPWWSSIGAAMLATSNIEATLEDAAARSRIAAALDCAPLPPSWRGPAIVDNPALDRPPPVQLVIDAWTMAQREQPPLPAIRDTLTQLATATDPTDGSLARPWFELLERALP